MDRFVVFLQLTGLHSTFIIAMIYAVSCSIGSYYNVFSRPCIVEWYEMIYTHIAKEGFMEYEKTFSWVRLI